MLHAWSNRISGATGGSARGFQFVMRRPSWVVRLALLAGVFVMLAVLAVIVIPAVIVGAAAFLALAATARVRAWIGGVRAPNGALDGRRNVRVIVRE